MSHQPPRPRPSPANLDLDLSHEISDDYAAAWIKPRRNRRLPLIITGVVLCFACGAGVGYYLARGQHAGSPPAPTRAGEEAGLGGVSGLQADPTEVALARQLAFVAVEEAKRFVSLGIGQGLELQRLLPSGGMVPDEISVEIRSTNREVRVRSGGSEVRPVAPSVYNLRRSEPVEVEFFSAEEGAQQLERLEIQITPFLELEQYDPYAPPP
ncbi:MAG: hypothetical protein JW797_00195 [Bradymonadales bacterium]|nr:hypothetical protein [Bradymonadales bacterium]